MLQDGGHKVTAEVVSGRKSVAKLQGATHQSTRRSSSSSCALRTCVQARYVCRFNYQGRQFFCSFFLPVACKCQSVLPKVEWWKMVEAHQEDLNTQSGHWTLRSTQLTADALHASEAQHLPSPKDVCGLLCLTNTSIQTEHTVCILV